MTAVIVTGAGAGIGRAAAIECCRAGDHVIACDRLADRAAETCDLVKAAGGSVSREVVDLRDAAAAARMVERAASAHAIKALVHSAALFPRLSFAQASPADFDDVMAVNFRAAFILAKACVPVMTRGGSLVFLTSGAGLIECADDPFQRPFSLYGASKAALDRWVRGIAGELSELGIAACTLTPGAVVDTPGVAAVRDDSFAGIATIDAGAVGSALAWLTAEPRLALAGQRLSAVEFGRNWGS